MKQGALTFVLGGLALALFLYVQPLLTIWVLSEALGESDTAAIRERMDAERVREGLRIAFLGRHEEDESSKGAGVVASALFGRGIEMILGVRASKPTADQIGGSTEIMQWGFDTTSRFHATLGQPTGAPMTVVLERRGTSWQVVEMQPSEAAWRELEGEN